MAKKLNTAASERVLALSEQLRNAIKLLIREMRRDAAKHESGLSLMQSMVLATVEEHPDIGVGELARLQNVRSPTISAQVKLLETAGLLDRGAPHPDDRRRSGLKLTRAGRESLQKLRTQRVDWLSKRIAQLPPEQIDALAGAIQPLNMISRT